MAYYANTHTALCYIPLSLDHYWTFTRRETVSGNLMLIDHATAQKNGAPFQVFLTNVLLITILEHLKQFDRGLKRRSGHRCLL